MKLTKTDYLNLANQLDDKEYMVQKSIHQFTNKEILPIIDKYFEDGEFPNQLIIKLADMNCFGINIPKEYSGAGMNNITYGLVCQEIERGDSSIRSLLSVQNSLVLIVQSRFFSM